MVTTHVFIVDSTTFKYHLEYLFAGTGAGEDVIDFNNKVNTSLNYAKENKLIGMIADSQRVRKGDFIIFYLQQSASDKIYEGKFYGIFRATEDLSFLDNKDSSQFLKTELVKSLTFRTLIEPYEIYRKGVTEWEALDEIKNLSSPNQMLWSLIYRKLKGNRGNTMITIYESERLFKLLRDKNNKKVLNGVSFTYDFDTQEIKENHKKSYTGKKDTINILPRLVKKYSEDKAFETHLQAYIVQNVGKGTNISLDKILLNNLSFEWLGNEVSCGVGMQRIDVMLSLKKDSSRIVLAIELKAVEADKEKNVKQIQRYVDWLEQYYIPNRVSDIQPVLISKKIEDKSTESYKEIIKSFNEFNKKNKNCFNLKYIEYEVKDAELIFGEVSY